jgi:acyl carrier protein
MDEVVTTQILDIVRRNVERQNRDAVRADALLNADLDMDSLKVLSTFLAIEQELQLVVRWDSPDIGEIKTVDDVIRFVTGSGTNT